MLACSFVVSFLCLMYFVFICYVYLYNVYILHYITNNQSSIIPTVKTITPVDHNVFISPQGGCKIATKQKMGYYSEYHSGRGLYYLKTGKKSPYC